MKKIAKYLTMALGLLALIIYLASVLGVFEIDDLFSYLYPILLILMSLATVLMLVFMFVEWFAPSAAKKTLIAFGSLAIILIASYAIADNDPLNTKASSSVAKLTGMGIWAFVLIAIVATASVVWSEIRKIIS